ncbi:MAG: transglycosylase domain-containing protein, partial [Brachybacterium sp.]
MSDSRRSSRGSSKNSAGGGARRAAGVRRASSSTSGAKPAKAASAKSSDAKGASRTGRSSASGATAAKGSSRTASAKNSAGAKNSARAKSSAGAKAPTRHTSVNARHAGTAAATSAGRGSAKGRKKKAAATNFLNYPRAGAKNPWRWIPSLRMIVGAMALMVLAGLGFAVWLYNDTEVPEPSDFALAQTSRVYYADGETEMGQFSEVNRTELPADEIPDNIKQAVVASEDSSFYENRGVSPRGIVRAMVNNLQGGARQGGSTITMQYVERYYTGTETS